MIRALLEDESKIKRVMLDESVYPLISDDGAPNPNDFDIKSLLSSNAILFLMPDENSVFMYVPMNAITYEVHSNILPASRDHSRSLALETVKYMFTETKCLKIITHVPEFNKAAFRLALACGLKMEGIDRSSFLKSGKLYNQYFLGLTKEEWKCQQQ